MSERMSIHLRHKKRRENECMRTRQGSVRTGVDRCTFRGGTTGSRGNRENMGGHVAQPKYTHHSGQPPILLAATPAFCSSWASGRHGSIDPADM